MQDVLIYVGVYAFLVLLFIMKPLFSYLLSLKGIRIKLVSKNGDIKSKIVYLHQSDPLYIQLKKERGL
ncbi:TPA: hypothetical protein I7715_16840 [Vibrio vulnificus]|nr:hypothetical protein [Vibrio vulnificus]